MGTHIQPIESHTQTAARHTHGALACFSSGVCYSPHNDVSVDGNTERKALLVSLPCVFTRVITVWIIVSLGFKPWQLLYQCMSLWSTDMAIMSDCHGRWDIIKSSWLFGQSSGAIIRANLTGFHTTLCVHLKASWHFYTVVNRLLVWL